MAEAKSKDELDDDDSGNVADEENEIDDFENSFNIAQKHVKSKGRVSVNTKDLVNRVKSKRSLADSSDEEQDDREDRRSARPSGSRGEIVDRLNHAGKLLWSMDQDKYKNEKRYANTRDSGDEGGDHMHWRKNWHPWV